MNELFDALERYDFECDGGPLHNCQEWQVLRKQVNALLDPETGEPLHFETPPCPSCGERMLGTATIGERRLLGCMGCGARFEAVSK